MLLHSEAPRRSSDLLRRRARRHWGAVGALSIVLTLGLALSLSEQLTSGPLVDRVGWLTLLAAFTVLWAGGLRSLAMSARYRMSGESPVRSAPGSPETSRVALLYCTADDLDEEALLVSMQQSRTVETVILDDSVEQASRRRVDAVAERVGARVIRRATRSGYKAGNLNHALTTLVDEFDHVAVLDSDTLLDRDFVARALAVLAANPGAGVVQSRIEARTGATRFTDVFGALLGTHLRVTQTARTAIGFGHFLGRGALISTACLRATDGLPEVVMEDVAFTLAAREAGYTIIYDPSLVTLEDYPIDYAAFRVQYRKMVEGATELLAGLRSRGLAARLSWWERLDLVWEQLNAPVASVAGLTAVTAGLALSAGGEPVLLPLWAALVTSVLVAAPLLPHTFIELRQNGLQAAVRFVVLGTLLYGSTMLVALAAASRVLVLRSARFRITPKTAMLTGTGLTAVLGADIAIGMAAALAALALTGTLLPVVPLLVPGLAGTFFIVWGGGATTRSALERRSVSVAG